MATARVSINASDPGWHVYMVRDGGTLTDWKDVFDTLDAAKYKCAQLAAVDAAVAAEFARLGAVSSRASPREYVVTRVVPPPLADGSPRKTRMTGAMDADAFVPPPPGAHGAGVTTYTVKNGIGSVTQGEDGATVSGVYLLHTLNGLKADITSLTSKVNVVDTVVREVRDTTDALWKATAADDETAEVDAEMVVPSPADVDAALDAAVGAAPDAPDA